MFPWEYVDRVLATKSEGAGLSNLCDHKSSTSHGHRQTDRRTDGRHAIPRPRKCTKVHCAVKTEKIIILGPKNKLHNKMMRWFYWHGSQLTGLVYKQYTDQWTKLQNRNNTEKNKIAVSTNWGIQPRYNGPNIRYEVGHTAHTAGLILRFWKHLSCPFYNF